MNTSCVDVGILTVNREVPMWRPVESGAHNPLRDATFPAELYFGNIVSTFVPRDIYKLSFSALLQD